MRQAYFVTREDKDFAVTELEGVTARLLKIPAHIFTYLLGQAEHQLWKQAGRRAEPLAPRLMKDADDERDEEPDV